MKAIENWMVNDVFTRRLKVWTHERYNKGVQGQTWWHVELIELEREYTDHAQAQQSMAWSNIETTYTGYGPSLAKAAKNALRRANEGRAKWEGAKA